MCPEKSDSEVATELTHGDCIWASQRDADDQARCALVVVIIVGTPHLLSQTRLRPSLTSEGLYDSGACYLAVCVVLVRPPANVRRPPDSMRSYGLQRICSRVLQSSRLHHLNVKHRVGWRWQPGHRHRQHPIAERRGRSMRYRSHVCIKGQRETAPESAIENLTATNRRLGRASFDPHPRSSRRPRLDATHPHRAARGDERHAQIGPCHAGKLNTPHVRRGGLATLCGGSPPGRGVMRGGARGRLGGFHALRWRRQQQLLSRGGGPEWRRHLLRPVPLPRPPRRRVGHTRLRLSRCSS